MKRRVRGSGTDATFGDAATIPPDAVIVAHHEQRFRALFSDGPAGQAFAALDGRIAAANTAFCRMLGRDPADVVGRTYEELTHPDDVAQNRQLVADLLAGRLASFQMAKRYVRPDGRPVPVLNTVTLIDAAGERLIAAVSVELREHRDHNDDVDLRDSRDGVRDVPVEEADPWFQDWTSTLDHVRIKWLWDAVATSSHELVWAIDSHGVIRYLSEVATDLLGAAPSDLIGNTVFDIIHPDDIDAARRIFADCSARKAGWDRVRMRALRPDGAVAWLETSAVAHVDHGNNLVGFTATARCLTGDEVTAVHEASTRKRLDGVMAERRLHTIWQPIYSLDTGRIVGVEALTRFAHPRIAQPPDRWFAEAHQIGVGEQLELLAIETALASAASLPESTYVSLNVSPATVADGELPSLIERAVVKPDRVVLELTEHVSIDDYGPLVHALERVRAAGVRIAVDDAGAGFASFRHILRLKPDIIKLDQSITRGIDDDPAQRALAAALVMFALDVGSVTVVAEGVETEEELSTVSSLGIDAVQGYYLARPAPSAEIDFEVVASHAWSR